MAQVQTVSVGTVAKIKGQTQTEKQDFVFQDAYTVGIDVFAMKLLMNFVKHALDGVWEENRCMQGSPPPSASIIKGLLWTWGKLLEAFLEPASSEEKADI